MRNVGLNRFSFGVVLLCFFRQAAYAPAQLHWETVTPHPKDARSNARAAKSSQDARFIECPPSQQDPDPLGYSVVHMSGPSTNRVNLVFIGDGFRADEMDAWAAHVDVMVSQLLSNESPPYDRYANFLNIYRIDLVSAESGVDDPDNDVCVDTALDGCTCCIDYTIGQCQVDWGKTFGAINEAMPGIEVHWRLVVLNTSIYLGGAHYPPEGTLAVYPSSHAASFYVLRHEGGHAFHLLGDEYYYPEYADNPYTGGEPWWVNLTIDPTGAKWMEWLGFSQPANEGPVGAYEGGLVNYGKGVWRPSQWSVMNSDTPLDAIGKERAIHSIYDLVDSYDDWGPRDPVVAPDAVLWVEVIDPNVIVVEWFIDGELRGSGPTLDLESLQLLDGLHLIEARAHDEVLDHAFSDNADPHPLDLVRRGTDTLRQVVSWETTVAGSGLCVDWVEASPATPPRETSDFGMVYDSSRGIGVAFGGSIGALPTVHNETWEWNCNSEQWVFRGDLPVSPPARWSHNMAYDPDRAVTVLFGGSSGGVALDDTWEYDGTAWVPITPCGDAPTDRIAHGMSHNPGAGVLLFGGHVGVDLNDTWIWDGACWTMPPLGNSPSAREYPAMAYDSNCQMTLLFGGQGGGRKNDLWSWDGTEWTQVQAHDPSASDRPSPRYAAGMVYDPTNQRFLLFGGNDGNSINKNDLWQFTWDCAVGSWIQLEPPESPPERMHMGFVFDESCSKAVLFGGWMSVTQRLNDTWLFETWSRCDCDDSNVCTRDDCSGGSCTHIVELYGDVDGNGFITLADLFWVLDGFQGDFSQCCFGDDDIQGSCGLGQPPCCPNGVINLFDLFAVLDAFAGEDPCCGGPP